MPFEVAKRWLHPAGIFPAVLKNWEETTSKYGPRVRWTFETNVQREDGKAPELSVWTGMSFGPKAQLNQLLISLEVDPPETDEEAELFNPDLLMGLQVQLEVRHTLGNDGTTWANVEKVAPLKKAAGNGPQPGVTPAPAEPQPELAGTAVAAPQGRVDPFEQQL